MTEERDPKVEALAKLDRASETFDKDREQYERSREALASAISEALQADIGPAEIERRVAYDRAHIDRLRRKAGIPPRRAATVQRIPKGATE